MRGLLLILFLPVILAGADAAKVFTDTIRPTLKQKCFGCHGEGNTFGKLDLRTREAMLKGGARGPSLTPGEAENSLLYQALNHAEGLEMPPGVKLDTAAIDAFRDWINGGAPFVEDQAAESIEWGSYDEADVWAFRPLRKVEPPIEARNPIDAFIDRKLAERGLATAPRADRRTLIRRATFDLTGLPPTPEEVDNFVNDGLADDQAFRKVVDRLLASPAYGERWGRHWLDVVRYADTGGYSNDFERPNAWRYRDYVIRSFNDDKPYDRFILEQVAGDELFPDDPEALIATGFLRTGPWEHTGMAVAAVTRQMWLDDVTHSTVNTFLGLTMGCAKCHDHKFDPISQRDYYRVQDVFATTAFARRKVDFLEVEHRDGFEEGEKRIQQLISQVEAKLAEYDELNKRRLFEKYSITDLKDLPKGVGKKSGLTAEEKEGQKLYSKQLSIHKESARRYRPLAFSVSSGLIDGANDVGPNGTSSYLKKADYENAETHVLTGGAVEAPGEKVAAGVLEAVERYGDFAAPEFPKTIAGRRAVLAKWIANERNPLTARVMANRIWQHHFGKALAENSNNLGKMGKRPTHPDLLEYLAARFIREGWSVKTMHRLIMSSQVYQRSGLHPNPGEVAEKDPENTRLAYFSPRRMEAEVLRDTMLSVAGELSDTAGGPGTYPQINRDVAEQPRHAMGSLRPTYYPEATKSARNRRSVYSFQQRSLIDPMIEVFNGAPLDMSCERRDSTTVPTQAFTLFNSEISYDLALAFAARLETETAELDRRVERAFRLAFGRRPDNKELELARRHIAEMTVYHGDTPPPEKRPREPLLRSITSELTGENYPFQEEPPPWTEEENLHPSDVAPETRALADLTLVLFNSNEFVYIY